VVEVPEFEAFIAAAESEISWYDKPDTFWTSSGKVEEIILYPTPRFSRPLSSYSPSEVWWIISSAGERMEYLGYYGRVWLSDAEKAIVYQKVAGCELFKQIFWGYPMKLAPALYDEDEEGGVGDEDGW
jgi:hypothetical protein